MKTIKKIKFTFFRRILILFGVPIRLDFNGYKITDEGRNEKGEICLEIKRISENKENKK